MTIILVMNCAFCMPISFFFGRGKTFVRWMNLGTMNLLKNCALCRTLSLRFEAPHILLLTLVCNLLKFTAIVSLSVGQKTIPRTFMFGEEVNHSKGHCFLSFQIPRPSNLVFWRLIRALVQSSKDSTMPHTRLMSSSHLTNKNWSSTWPPTTSRWPAIFTPASSFLNRRSKGWI